jgi:diguanylate cyclase (GGDEF)-like protein/PAS domain S-box-containing protein
MSADTPVKREMIPDFSEEKLFQSLMDYTADSIYFKDRDCRLVRVNQRMAISLGFENSEMLVGKTDVELFGNEFGEKTRLEDLRVMETGQPIIGLVESRERMDGGMNWTSTTKIALRDENGNVYGLMGITREINELIQVEHDLQFLATHDVLTSLPNRYLLFDRMDQALFRAQRYGSMLAVLFLDLDDFKKINDSFGHAVGDLLLVQISNHLKGLVRDLDTVARIGGDEFIIILESIQNESEIIQIAERIVKDLPVGIDIYPTNPEVSVSIGISLFPQHGTSAAKLIACADDAMYRAKVKKNNFAFYSCESKSDQ